MHNNWHILVLHVLHWSHSHTILLIAFPNYLTGHIPILHTPMQAHRHADVLQHSVQSLIKHITLGMEDGSLTFKQANRLITEQGDVSGQMFHHYMY